MFAKMLLHFGAPAGYHTFHADVNDDLSAYYEFEYVIYIILHIHR